MIYLWAKPAELFQYNSWIILGDPGSSLEQSGYITSVHRAFQSIQKQIARYSTTYPWGKLKPTLGMLDIYSESDVLNLLHQEFTDPVLAKLKAFIQNPGFHQEGWIEFTGTRPREYLVVLYFLTCFPAPHESQSGSET